MLLLKYFLLNFKYHIIICSDNPEWITQILIQSRNFKSLDKIVLVSPINFYALVSFIKHSETLLKVTREQKSIIRIFGSLKEQWGKYEASFEKVEDRLTQLSKEIETVKITRTKAMSRELNKVDNILNSNSIEESD